jgi:broad specificity phosphatase PhoE
MKRLYLVRHGETDWNAAGRLQGSSDIPLNDKGRAQALALASQLSHHGVERVWTSDLSRARETGAIIAAHLGLEAPSVEADLRERRFGVFEGLTRDEIAARYPVEWRSWHDKTVMPEGGEAREASIARLAAALERLWDQTAGTSLVVSHGGIIRLWLSELAGFLVPNIANGATFVVEREGTAFHTRSL